MFDIPLHPVVVHFPIVLSVLLPVIALVALRAIRRGAPPRAAWGIPLAFAAALAVSSYVALKTGENEEDTAKKVVSRSAIHEHEEASERFMILSGVLLVVAAGGLLPRAPGRAARIVATTGAVGLVAAAVQVGHLGGELVYKHGAASAYVDPSTTPATVTPPPR